MLALLAVRFAWTIIFILFSLQTMPHVVAGNPPTAGDTNACSAWLPRARFSCFSCRSA